MNLRIEPEWARASDDLSRQKREERRRRLRSRKRERGDRRPRQLRYDDITINIVA